ncbi:TetR/AcrR family transcriptional regulator [Nonomuraea sp. NPDC050536]|uniref:TetR/AcrR family transcriptional regulator n=1 Tax=Nonomuraea sp. NPDC050536 TaxID=3364366 RepID=UPI0037CB8B2B
MKLTQERIVDAGMATFAELGYHGLSMRQVAERLDARAGSLYYHVKSKNDLLAMMADRVCQHAYDTGTVALEALPAEATWRDQVEVQAVTLRQSLQEHPGGAILLADSPKVLSTGGLSLMERLLRTLLDAGVPTAHRGIAADTLLSHITGFVLQEQSESQAPAITAERYVDLRTRFPLTIDQTPRRSQDEKFHLSIHLLCTGIETLITPATGTR